MSYIIKEVHLVYENKDLQEIAVLWQSNEKGWVRASCCNLKPCYGYKFLLPKEEISMSLIQDVTGSGANFPDDKKIKYFPGKKLWER